MTTQILLNGITVDELIARLKVELAPAAPAPSKDISEDFITVKEVSKLLGVSEVTIHKWKTDGKIKYHRFGSRIRFKKSEVIEVAKFKTSKSKKAL
jgi:excisionase family DNA binding protein